MTSPKYKLIYFDYHWLAEPIRLLLSYVKEDFEDIRLDWEEWEKPDGKMDKSPYPYEKLPILEDAENGLKLGQSFSILRYLGRKHNLVGKSEMEAAKCDEYADVLKDILKDMEAMWEKDEKTTLDMKTKWLEKTIPRYYSVIESDLKKNGGKYLVGDAITWVDFLCAQMNQLFTVYPKTDVLANYPTIRQHQQLIFDLPDVKAWITKRPVNPYEW
ncbi:Glutathione S-transferase [Orchesella cincta]|uniref:glutathione transferase n=1 Tax=Orchesella cincta TaxID=48709 RepID=A0A1D2M787_ORCCI|nr:Glutathione S-transferase [Orchesella cincta]